MADPDPVCVPVRVLDAVCVGLLVRLLEGVPVCVLVEVMVTLLV